MNKSGRVRPVEWVHQCFRTLEGGGFPVRRPFPVPGLDQLDPFLLLDEMGPIVWPPGGVVGAPEHPHRGFETVTYLLRGEVEHRDSGGHCASIGPGGVQWMTAGAGVVHSEMPTDAFNAKGGLMHGFQLWVNLPKDKKRIAPRYQELSPETIPTVDDEENGCVIRLIAGSLAGIRSPLETTTPVTYAHVTVYPDGRFEHPISDATAGAAVFAGRGTAGAGREEIADGDFVCFGPGEILRIENGTQSILEMMLLAANPLGDPMVRYGPFVMNTRDEIVEAIRDYQTGKMGQIPLQVG